MIKINSKQKAALNKALTVAEDIMTIYEKECGFDEDYECGKMVSTLIDLIDAFIDQIEITEAKELLSEATDMLYLIVERYELGDVSAETEAAFKKVKEKAQRIKNTLNLREVIEMEKSERILLNTAINAIHPLVTAYNTQEWSTEATNFSVVLDAVLDVACVFIPESRAREVIEEIIKARDIDISRRRKCRSLKYKINHE